MCFQVLSDAHNTVENGRNATRHIFYSVNRLLVLWLVEFLFAQLKCG